MFALFARTSKVNSTRAGGYPLDPNNGASATRKQHQQLFTAPASKVPTVMLLGYYGASTLGMTLRRQRNLMTTMSSIEKDSSISTTENMRSTASKMGGRALSTPTRANSSPPSNRTWIPNNGIVFSGTWSPNNGIVFRPAAGTPRSMSTNAVESIRQDHLLHSEAEDNYVMASGDMAIFEHQSTSSTKVMVAADSEEKPAPSLKTSKVQKASDVTPISKQEPFDPKQKAPPKTTIRKSKDTKGTKPCEAKSDAVGSDAKAVEAKPEPEVEPEDPAQNEVPETTTVLKMTEETFRKAKDAEAGSPDSYWSHSLYRGPITDGKAQTTKVHYCKSVLTTERVLKTFFADSKVIGFDIEWKENAHRNSDAKHNVSLIQIANEERIALFHVALYPKRELVSPTFKKIMEDDSITKVGVSIKGDCTRLRKHLGIDSKGMLELSHLYKLVKYSEKKSFREINRRLVSLATQTREHLHLPMFKGDVRISDWSKKLSYDQIMYAASDSYAGLQIFHTLEMKRKALDPTPPRPYHAELNLPIRIAEGVEIPSDAEAEEAEAEPEPETSTPAPSRNPNQENSPRKN